MNKLKKYTFNITSNILFCMKMSYFASKKYFLLKAIILLSTTFLPLLNLWIWKEILNNIVVNNYNSINNIVVYMIMYLIILFSVQALSQINYYVNKRYDDELSFYMDEIILEKSSQIDLAFFESSSMADKFSNVINHFGAAKQMTWLAFDIISEAINIISTFLILSIYNVWLAILTIILLIPYMKYNKKRTEKLLNMEKEQTCDRRKIEYYNDAFFDVDILFEIKLNNIGKYFIGKHQELWHKLYEINTNEKIIHNIKSTFLFVINMMSEFLILILSIFSIINNKIGIGDLQYNISMVSRLREQASMLVTDINSFLVDNKRINELNEFMKLKPILEKSGTMIPTKNPRIEFENVWFRYPNSKDFVLRNCSFVIEPNEKIGLIGLNGSGKSTIIKLIFRFYDPDEGCIKINGIDLKEYDIYEVRKIFGVLFQDYVTYCLPLREIIALSDFDQRFNDERLKYACDISGVTNIIKDWEDGFDSILGRYYADNGKDLSGGQWQLVGLARAYFKESEYMILDEPSAALDPISEDRIFEQMYKLSANKTSISISHRLSNTTLSDKILVIDEGYIIEAGSHVELLKQEGKYAHLFNLQASKYA